MNIAEQNLIDDFRNFVAEHGETLPTQIIADGKIHRYRVEGSKIGSLDGAYLLNGDGVPNGWYQNHKIDPDNQIKWVSKHPGNHSQQPQQTKSTPKEIPLNYEQKAIKAREQLVEYKPVTEQSEHDYLIKKSILPHGIYLNKSGGFNSLVIPFSNENFEVVGLQFIEPDGSKRNRYNKGFFTFGVYDGTILTGEGFATNASIFESSELFTVMAGDAGNLKTTAQAMRKIHPEALIVICSDNDKNRVGQKAAHEAAAAVNGIVIMPPIEGTDFHNYLTSGNVSVSILDMIQSAKNKKVAQLQQGNDDVVFIGDVEIPEPPDYLYEAPPFTENLKSETALDTCNELPPELIFDDGDYLADNAKAPEFIIDDILESLPQVDFCALVRER
jgi:putative DNA primase/helicase